MRRRVLPPLPRNGQAFTWRIPWRARLNFLRLGLSYRSQLGSWAGLFPAMLPGSTRRNNNKGNT